jgi:hypothetical protein
VRYLLMAQTDRDAVAGLGPDEHAALMQRYVDFTTALAQSGVLRGAEQLQPADTATTVRVRGGTSTLTDGPFADVVESFGGFWIVDAPDLDTALAHASSCPAALVGSVEVRALVDLDRPSPAGSASPP